MAVNYYICYSLSRTYLLLLLKRTDLMKIEGTYTLQASPDHVWDSLMDPQVLRDIIPGVEKLEKLDGNTYEATIQIKHAPLKGSYHGHITITDQQFPRHYCIEIRGEGRQTLFSGNGHIQLDEQNNNTIIAYRGELKPDKRNSWLPPAVLKGAAKLLIQQFFAALALQLGTRPSTARFDMYTPATTGSVIHQPGGTITILSPKLATQPEPSAQHATLLQTLIRWSRAGDDDPQEIARLEKRIRSFSIIAGLLFLVWVGTRIPRKR
jgi:carbon monoxide dehydrogenase subunit G